MSASHKKDQERLGMNIGTANRKLVRMMLFKILKDTKLNICLKCGEEIGTLQELTLDHITNWRGTDNPVELFFDTNNVKFSHGRCNNRRSKKLVHGTITKYTKRKCRCPKCREANAKYMREYRKDPEHLDKHRKYNALYVEKRRRLNKRN